MLRPNEKIYPNDLPLDYGLVIVRTVTGVVSNVEQAIINHSPDGFEYGYGGSGPADFALNILHAVCENEGIGGSYAWVEVGYGGGMANKVAAKLYQKFKTEVIAALPRDENHFIPYSLIVAWIRANLEDES